MNRLAMFEQLNGSIRYDPDRLAGLRFNPLLSETYKKFSLFSDDDPDANFFSELADCEYYIEGKFNEMLQQKNILGVNNCLSLLHLNIRSLHRNLDSLTTLLKNVELRFSFIGITETWLWNSSLHPDISGYNFVHNPRKDRTGGGVVLYLADNFDFKCRPDLVFSCTECAESLFVEINRPKEKNIIVGVVYRPPNQKLQNFMNSLDLLLASISKENKICYLVCDWNLDLIKHHCHESTGEFLEIMYSRMFFPLITCPTRLTSNTATLIDNIFTNNLNNFSVSGLMFCDISDHLPNFTLLLGQNKILNETSWLSFRDKSANNFATFTNRLANVNWDELSEYKDPDCAYRCFLDKYTTLYNDCFPLKKVKAKNVTLSNPWITKGLLKSVRKKNLLYNRFLSKSRIPASDKSHRSFLDGSFINSFFLQSASEQEVTEICSSFRSGTAPSIIALLIF